MPHIGLLQNLVRMRLSFDSMGTRNNILHRDALIKKKQEVAHTLLNRIDRHESVSSCCRPSLTACQRGAIQIYIFVQRFTDLDQDSAPLSRPAYLDQINERAVEMRILKMHNTKNLRRAYDCFPDGL